VIRVKVNRETCRGYGNCVLVAGHVFDLDDDGLVVIEREELEDSDAGAIRRAAYDCPTSSIAFEEHPAPD
jgi:ferredoxin